MVATILYMVSTKHNGRNHSYNVSTQYIGCNHSLHGYNTMVATIHCLVSAQHNWFPPYFAWLQLNGSNHPLIVSTQNNGFNHPLPLDTRLILNWTPRTCEPSIHLFFHISIYLSIGLVSESHTVT